MNIFAFLPAIFGSILVATIFRNSELENKDYAGKIWGYIFALLIAWFATFLTEKAIEYENYVPSVPRTEYYDYDY